MPRAPRIPSVRVAVPIVEGTEQSARCPKGCGTYLEFTPDAIGRLRERCPTCDGIGRRPALHSSLQATQQALVPIVRVAEYSLPPIAPGQLRCQRCAFGVEPKLRFCDACTAVLTAPKPRKVKAPGAQVACERCGRPIERGKVGRPPKIHDECLTPVEWAQRKAKRAQNERARKKVAA